MEGSQDEFVVPETLLAEIVVADDLLVIDASGANGTAGRDGRSYAGSRATNGQRGRDGEDATAAQPGENAGDIEVTLQPASADESHVEVVGRLAEPRGAERVIRKSVAVGTMGVIRLLACGGRGGDGGRGGEGQDGGKGYDGSGATRWSSGGDGGPGGDGGDGGDGTDGADGGRGGRVVVRVDDRDTHLLMLTKYQVPGGERGNPGANGPGGKGGPGGDGGGAYTWTTTSTEHYTDAQGNRQSRTVTHHHRNRGGSDGSSGRRGRDGQGRLQAGEVGEAGDVQILVRKGQQDILYLQRYEVAITDQVVELTDEFAEPTSVVRVSRLTVQNTGGMPTPSRHPVVVDLSASRWLQPRPHLLQLPRSLEPGESYTFTDDQLLGDVPDIDYVPQGDPLRQIDRISPLARQTGANRLFDNLHPRHEFTIAFPSELEPIRSLESQTPGSAAMFVIGVTNRSQHDLGREADSKRFLGVRLVLENPELAPHVMLLDTEGKPVAWNEGYQREIGSLRAGETWTDELIVGILPGAPGYRQAELKVALQLGQLDDPHQARDRHCRVYPVRIAQAYDYDPTADMLLVANHGTTLEELAAWKTAAAQLEQTVGVWDISLNDSLSLSERLAHGASLLRDFHGRTIVLGNAPFRTSMGTRYGDQFLSQMDLIKAAESHGIRVLVINDEQHEVAHLFRERLVPTDGEPEYRYDSMRALEKAEPLDDVDVLFDQVDELIEHGAQAARPDPISQTSQIDLYGIRSPNARRLKKQAAQLQRKLQDDSPGQRVVVMYKLPAEFTEEEQKKRAEETPRGGWFFTHEYQGSLLVMPTLGDGHPNLVVLNASPAQIHEPEFVGSAAVSAAVIQALGFEEKVFLLSSKLQALGQQWRVDPDSVEQSEIGVTQFLVDAILVDLATEQAAILKTPWKRLFSGSLVPDALRQLQLLTEHPFTLLSGDAEQPDVQLAARLVAGVEFLGQTSSRWYESRLFPWGFFRRGPVLRKEILAQQKKLTKNLFRQPNESQSKLIGELVDQYYEQRRQSQQKARTDKRTAARQVLFAPLLRHGIITDAGRAFPEVLSFQEWTAIQQTELQREASRVALREQKEDNRATFGVARDGRPLDGIGPKLQRALQPFVAACDAARTELQQQVPRRARTVPSTLPPITNVSKQPESAEENTDRIPPIRDEA